MREVRVASIVEVRPSRVRTEWIGRAPAARILGGIAPRLVDKVCKAAGVRSRALPTQPTRWHRGDVEALAARSIVDPMRTREGG
jgi:hypothetical protein